MFCDIFGFLLLYIYIYVLTHNPRNHNIFKTAKQFFPIIQQSETLRDLIKPKDILHSRRQPPNLKKILTTAKFTSNPEKPMVSKCEDPRCGTCQVLKTGQTIIFKNGMKFDVKSSMTCKSKNLIYCMTCPTCEENYIGQTGTKLADRVRVHKQQIKDPTIRNTPCSEHFDSCGKGHFYIFPFYKIKEENEQLRKAKEQYFISLFKPKLNC